MKLDSLRWMQHHQPLFSRLLLGLAKRDLLGLRVLLVLLEKLGLTKLGVLRLGKLVVIVVLSYLHLESTALFSGLKIGVAESVR